MRNGIKSIAELHSEYIENRKNQDTTSFVLSYFYQIILQDLNQTRISANSRIL